MEAISELTIFQKENVFEGDSKHYKIINKDCPDHTLSFDEVQVLDREQDWFTRGIKEAIHIRK